MECCKNPEVQYNTMKCLLPKCVAPRLRKARMIKQSGGFFNCAATHLPLVLPEECKRAPPIILEMSEEGRGFDRDWGFCCLKVVRGTVGVKIKT